LERAFQQALTAIALALVTAGAWAHQPAVTVIYPDRQIALHIQAETMSVQSPATLAIFSGDVLVTHGNARLQCSKALVWYSAMDPNDQHSVDRIECER
jgi:lipopolysaccharide export system protein LptA